MLLNIYLGTTAFSWATVLIFAKALANKMKRKGYKAIKEESLSEKIVSLMSSAFKLSIPVFNIIIAVAMICMGEKYFSLMEEHLLEEGEIYMPVEEELNSGCERKVLNQEEVNRHTESILKTKTEKPYDEMTIEEKIAFLEQERQKLLNNNIQANESYTLGRRNK